MFKDSWDDSLEEDRKSNQRSSGKKMSLMFRPTEAPIHIHLGYPEKPYIHPKTGAELPFRPGAQHFVPGAGKSRNGAYIECGEECVVCAYTNPASFGLSHVKPDEKYAKLPPKPYYGVSGWVEEEFHMVEYQHEAPREGTFKQRELCQGRGCELCKDNWPKIFGKRMFMQVNAAQWNYTFHDLNKRIQNSHCRCGGSICVSGFHCGKCDKLVLDVATICDCKASGSDIILDCEKGKAQCSKCKKTWSAVYTEHPKIFEESKKPHQCRCGHKGYLAPHRMCSTDGCEVDPYSIFDCQLVVRTTGVDKTKRLVIEDYSIQEPDSRLFDPAQQGDGEFASKIAESNQKPLDLDYVLKADSPDLQASSLGKANPFNASAASNARKFARYGEEDKAPPADDSIPF